VILRVLAPLWQEMLNDTSTHIAYNLSLEHDRSRRYNAHDGSDRSGSN